jgi:5-methylcytosine-specific restriction endonuclease McrA
MVSNPRTKNGHRRRQVCKQVYAEEDICIICGSPVDKSITCDWQGKPHPLRPEVHEVIPVSRGGSPTERSNCHLAHRICNEKQGNRLPWETPNSDKESELAVTHRFPLSRSW